MKTKEIHQLEEKLELVKKQEFIMNFLFININKTLYEPNKEYLANYSLDTAWCDYSFVIRKILYRMKNCIMLLEKILDSTESLPRDKKIILAFNTYKGDELSYELEDMVIAFSKLYEENIVCEVYKYLPKKYASKFIDNCPNRKDVNGLYWRINLLRNRVVHSTGGRYLENKDYATRFTTFSSKINVIEYDFTSETPIKIQCSLIDIEYDSKLKQIIQDVAISKIYGEDEAKKNIFDILFPEKVAKGHGKNKPNLCEAEISTFDFYSGLLSLSEQILDHCQMQINVFFKSAIEKCTDSILKVKVAYSETESFGICDVFDIKKPV